MKKGFTLAEVLITLGIIGVVAAVTIPTLINNYNTKTWNTAATLFERKLTEALKTMNTQASLTGHMTTENFVKELSGHLKTLKTCNNEELANCFSETLYWGTGDAIPEPVDVNIIKTSKNFGLEEWETNVVGVQFANGTNALIAYNPTETCKQDPHSNQITGLECLAILYDTSGYKNPNTSGKDIRVNYKIKKVGKGCAFELNETCYTTVPFIPTPLTKAECEQMILDGYGIKACTYEEDYWAGAVKECGGVHKLPTQTQITELANYVYNGTSYTLLDKDKSITLGFLQNNANYFRIWSNKEHSAEKTYCRHFGETNSYWSGSDRYSNLPFAVCLSSK